MRSLPLAIAAFGILSGCAGPTSEASLAANSVQINLRVFSNEFKTPADSVRFMILQAESDAKPLLEATDKLRRGNSFYLARTSGNNLNFQANLQNQNPKTFGVTFGLVALYTGSSTPYDFECSNFRELQNIYLPQFLAANPNATEINIDAIVNVTYEPSDFRKNVCRISYKINDIPFPVCKAPSL